MPTIPILVVRNPHGVSCATQLLRREGHIVETADSAEEALHMMRVLHPRVVLVEADAGGDGLEVARLLKANPESKNANIIVAVEDEDPGESAFDGVISNPSESGSLPREVLEMIEQEAEPVPATHPVAPEKPSSANGYPFDGLREAFLAAGATEATELLDELKSNEGVETALKRAHDWAGLGGMFGFPEITRRAREVEHLLEKKDAGVMDHVRRSLRELASLFQDGANGPPPVPAPQLPSQLHSAVARKRIAVSNFGSAEASSLSKAFDQQQALAQPVPPLSQINGAMLDAFDLVILNLPTTLEATGLLAAADRIRAGRPVLLVGAWDVLSNLGQAIQCWKSDFLIAPWEPEEVLLRTALLLTQPEGPQRTLSLGDRDTRRRILIADDDPTTLSLIHRTLSNSGMECLMAGDGAKALDIARSMRPDAIILDVNMPTMDGFQVLTSIRQDPRIQSVRVLILTARQREADVIRGFGLGADDYVVKPFGPMELVARLKRLLVRV